jgi:hypothetical protein
MKYIDPTKLDMKGKQEETQTLFIRQMVPFKPAHLLKKRSGKEWKYLKAIRMVFEGINTCATLSQLYSASSGFMAPNDADEEYFDRIKRDIKEEEAEIADVVTQIAKGLTGCDIKFYDKDGEEQVFDPVEDDDRITYRFIGDVIPKTLDNRAFGVTEVFFELLLAMYQRWDNKPEQKLHPELEEVQYMLINIISKMVTGREVVFKEGKEED